MPFALLSEFVHARPVGSILNTLMVIILSERPRIFGWGLRLRIF